MLCEPASSKVFEIPVRASPLRLQVCVGKPSLLSTGMRSTHTDEKAKSSCNPTSLKRAVEYLGCSSATNLTENFAASIEGMSVD